MFYDIHLSTSFFMKVKSKFGYSGAMTKPISIQIFSQIYAKSSMTYSLSMRRNVTVFKCEKIFRIQNRNAIEFQKNWLKTVKIDISIPHIHELSYGSSGGCYGNTRTISDCF